MRKRGAVVALVAFVASVFGLPPARAEYVVAAAFIGAVTYTSPLTTPVTSRSATLTTDNCIHQGVPTPSKGPLVIEFLQPCMLRLTMPFNVSAVTCLPVGFTAAFGTFQGKGGPWNLTAGNVTPQAVFGGVALVVTGNATQAYFPFQSGPFTVVAVLAPTPVANCLTNVSRSVAIGEFHLAAVL